MLLWCLKRDGHVTTCILYSSKSDCLKGEKLSDMLELGLSMYALMIGSYD